ncbi:DUF4136 domain-containing protein [Chitinophaga japonensis]|nr:DUF4136 domain-containing protein [Chitinophaga japonensis]
MQGKSYMLIVALTGLILLFACTSTTHITGAWKNPEVKPAAQGYDNIFVAAMSRNVNVRTQVENALAAALSTYDKRTLKSIDYFAPRFQETLPSREAMLQKIRTAGADAILTTSLIDKQSETRYVPGTAGYAPVPAFGWYRGFYAYYAHWYPVMYSPGYYVTDKTYFIETNLYDADSEQLLWSAQTETVNPGSLDRFLQDYPEAVLTQMKRDGLLR